MLTGTSAYHPAAAPSSELVRWCATCHLKVKLLRAQGFSSPIPDLFGKLVRVALIYQSSRVDALREFLVRKRWVFRVPHLHGSFLRHLKDELLDPPSSECLFIRMSLSQFVSEYKEDTFFATHQLGRMRFHWLPSLQRSQMKAQALTGYPSSSFLTRGQNRGGYKHKGLHSSGWVKVSFWSTDFFLGFCCF